MKFKLVSMIIRTFALVCCLSTSIIYAQLPGANTGREPWTADQLLAPEKLAATIKDSNATHPIILSVSPGPVIPGSIDIGPTSDKSNLERLKTHLKTISKDADVVLYCGCCPFERCPNIRPAFSLMTEMGFKNHKLLNLPNNVRMDWINKGYPVAELK